MKYQQLSLFDDLLNVAESPSLLTKRKNLQILQNYFVDLGIPKNLLWGNDVRQMIDHLLVNGYYPKQAWALWELCNRFSETRLSVGDQFSCSKDIFEHFKSRLKDLNQEQFIIVCLNNKHCYMCEMIVTKGTLNKSLVHPREVFACAIENRSAAIVCVHNHPSGDPKASKDDIQITHRLKKVGTVVGIPLLDHVIIGNDRYFSLADQGLLSDE